MKMRPELTEADCEALTSAAVAEARRHQWVVAVAVVDDGGHLLRFVRMDGATPANAGIAVEKGRSAALSRRTTGSWQERVQSRRELMKMPGILPVQGGVPILVDDACVGGVGVSGVQSHEDEQIARAGIEALLKR